MTTLELSQSWQLGPQLGEGGFGRVYEARSDDGAEAVAKLVPKVAGAERELLFERLSDVPNVMPVIDTGETDDEWVMIMPRADMSLRQYLESQGGSLSSDEVTVVLLDILTALAALDGDVVHRDIKPENVLFYEARWVLADFGIARYAEATTAPDTHKFSMTPAYAAPERWRGERATAASDIYSLGVMAFEMLAGTRPYSGPADHDLRDQHLHSNAPSVPNCPPRLASLVTECMFKAAEARPTAANLLQRLSSSDGQSGAAARLQAVNQKAVEEKAKEGARVSAARSERERRNDLSTAATSAARETIGELARQIKQAAPEAGSTFPFSLGGATLSVALPSPALPSALTYYDYAAPFDVIAFGEINLAIRESQWQYYGRSHSLWYCDAQDEGQYRWYEVAFMFNPLVGKRGKQNPFAMQPSKEAGEALSPVTGEFQPAWPFTPIDQGNGQEFIDRWIGWFADAAEGKLQHPRNMPERDSKGSWRGR